MPASILERLIDEAFGSAVRAPVAKSRPPQAKTGPDGKASPVRITSPYGNRVHPVTHNVSFHAGTDIAGKTGDPVYSIAAGVVTSVKNSSTAGLYITIKHEDGLVSKYMHLSQYSVKPGQPVVAGQRIGSVGATGRVTGPHLHLEVWQNGSHIRPTGQQAAIASGKPITGET